MIFKFNTLRGVFVLNIVFLFIISNTAYPQNSYRDNKEMLQEKVDALYEDNAALLDETFKLRKEKREIESKFYEAIESAKREVEELQFDSKGQEKSSRTINLLTKEINSLKRQNQDLENNLNKEINSCKQ